MTEQNSNNIPNIGQNDQTLNRILQIQHLAKKRKILEEFCK